MKIEGDNISAFEVAHHLNVLKGNVMLRNEEQYLDPKTEKEMNRLIAAEKAEKQSDDDENDGVDGDDKSAIGLELKAIFTQFYGKYYNTVEIIL